MSPLPRPRSRLLGEAFTWLLGGALAFNLLLIAGLLALIAHHGLVHFWPVPLIELRLGAIGATDQLWVNVGALCGAVVSLLWNFLGYKRVVFRS